MVKRSDLRLIGLQLVESTVECGILVAGVLQFNDAQRESIDEDHYVGATIGPVLNHGELVYGEPVVGVGIVEVDEVCLFAANRAVCAPNLNRHPLDHVTVEPAVLLDKGWGFGLSKFREDFRTGLCGKGWVEFGDCGADTLDKEHITVASALRLPAIWADVEAVGGRVTQFFQPSEGGFFDMAWRVCNRSAGP